MKKKYNVMQIYSIEVKNLDESIDKLNEIILLFNAEIIFSNKFGMDFNANVTGYFN